MKSNRILFAGILVAVLQGMLVVGATAQTETDIFPKTETSAAPAPTLYYAVKGGNIMARKLAENVTYSQDLGVSAGEHAFNLLFADSTLYIIDAGKQFANYTYSVDDSQYQTSGDGLIRALAPNGTKVDTIISNIGGHAYQDPYYGYIEGNDLYYTDRCTGVFRIPLTTRNAQWNIEDYPYYFQNRRLGYYSRGLTYGAINGCIGKVEGLWYWGKTFNGAGIWRFTDSDILPDTDSYMTADKPKAGGILNSDYYYGSPKSFVYDPIRRIFYFSLYGNVAGVYKIAIDDIEELRYIKNTDGMKPYLLDADVQINPVIEDDKGEGSVREYIGICQMALDEATGDVYFGYRAADPEQTGLYRYNAATGKLNLVPDTKGVEIYGITVDNTPTILFTPVQSLAADTHVTVYPNPTADALVIDGAVQDAHISIYSLSGNLLLTQTASEGTNKIDVTSLPDGLYILRLGNEVFKFTKE